MTSHYDLKQQEKNNGVLVAGLGGGGVTNIFVISLGGGGREFFSNGRQMGRQNFCLPHENVTAPPPHLVINDSSLNPFQSN